MVPSRHAPAWRVGFYSFTVAGASVNTTPDKPDANPVLVRQNARRNLKSKPTDTGLGLAAAVSVNYVTDATQASLSDATVHADAVDVKANNQNRIVAASGGLAFTTASGSTVKNNAAALAGGLSDNQIHATTDAFIRNADLTLRGVPFDNFVVETAKRRLSLTADNAGEIWALAAGGAAAGR